MEIIRANNNKNIKYNIKCGCIIHNEEENMIWIATDHGQIKIFNNNLIEISEIDVKVADSQKCDVLCMYEMNGWVWCGCNDGMIKVFSVDGVKITETGFHAGPVRCIIGDQQHNYIYSGSDDFSIQQYSCRDGSCTKQWQTNDIIYALCIVEHNNHITLWSGNDHGIQIWSSYGELLANIDPSTGQKFKKISDYNRSQNCINCIIKSNGYIWTGGHDHYITVWEPQNYRIINRWQAHQHQISFLCKISNNDILSCAFLENRIKFWINGTFLPDNKILEIKGSIISIVNSDVDHIYVLTRKPNCIQTFQLNIRQPRAVRGISSLLRANSERMSSESLTKDALNALSRTSSTSSLEGAFHRSNSMRSVDVTSQIKKKEKKIKALESENKTIKERLMTLASKYRAELVNREKIAKQIQLLKVENSKMQQNSIANTSDQHTIIETLQHELAQVKTINDNLNNEILQIKAEKKNLEAKESMQKDDSVLSYETISQSQSESEFYGESMSDIDHALIDSSSTQSLSSNQDKQQNINSHVNRIQTLNEKVAMLHDENVMLRQTLDNLKQSQSKQKIRTKLDNLQTELISAKKEADSKLHQQQLTHQREIKALKQQLLQLESKDKEIKSKSKQIALLEAELQKVRESDEEELRSKSERIALLEAELQKVRESDEEELRSKSERIALLEAELQKVREYDEEELKSKSERIALLEAELQKVRESDEQEIKSKSERIALLEAELQKNGNSNVDENIMNNNSNNRHEIYNEAHHSNNTKSGDNNNNNNNNNKNDNKINKSPLGEALAGQFGGIFSATFSQPLDVVKTRLQMKDAAEMYTGVFQAIYKIARDQGWPALFVGLKSEYLKTAVSNFIYFFAYSYLKKKYSEGKLPLSKPNQQMGVLYNILVGMFCGALQQLVVTPLSTAQTQIIVNGNSKATLLGTMSGIVKSDGVSALWKGLTPSLILTLNPAIQFFVYDRVKLIWQRLINLNSPVPREMTSLEHFVCGAIAKFVATVATYPLILARTRLFLRSGSSGTLIGALFDIIRNDGLFGLYAGIEAQIVKSMFGAGLSFMMKERVDSFSQSIAQLILDQQ